MTKTERFRVDVLNAAVEIHEAGEYPTAEVIRDRLLGRPWLSTITRYYATIADLRREGRWPIPKDPKRATRTGAARRARLRLVVEGPAPTPTVKLAPKPERQSGPFADDVRRSLRVLRWARSHAAERGPWPDYEPREVAS